jgi:hypothetical protein
VNNHNSAPATNPTSVWAPTTRHADKLGWEARHRNASSWLNGLNSGSLSPSSQLPGSCAFDATGGIVDMANDEWFTDAGV